MQMDQSLFLYAFQLPVPQHLGNISILPFFCATSIFTQHMGNISMLLIFVHCSTHVVHTEWQRPLSGVHPIMMEKLAQAGGVGDAGPPPFIVFTVMYKVAVYAPAERVDGYCALPLFHLYPYVLCGSTPQYMGYQHPSSCATSSSSSRGFQQRRTNVLCNCKSSALG